MTSYKLLRKLCIRAALRYGDKKILSDAMNYRWHCGEYGQVYVSYTTGDFPITLIYRGGILLHKDDDCTEALSIVRQFTILDEIADA